MDCGRKYTCLCTCFTRLLNRQVHAREAQTSAAQSASNLYDILKVPVDATAQEIKDAYYTLSRLYHPDVNGGGDRTEATQKFQEINDAYQILGNEAKRTEYDNKLFGFGAEFPSGQPFGTSKYEMDSAQMKEYMEFRRRFRREGPAANWSSDFSDFQRYAKYRSPGSDFHWNIRDCSTFDRSWVENSNNFARRSNSAFHNYVQSRRRQQAKEEAKLSVLSTLLVFLTLLIAVGSIPTYRGPHHSW